MKKKINKYNVIAFVAISTGAILFFGGCSKNQDVKIVHNYFDKTPVFSEQKKQAALDVYTYKLFKGSDNAIVYKRV